MPHISDLGHSVTRAHSSRLYDRTISHTNDTGTHHNGRLTSASDANHSLAWTYDTHGRVTLGRRDRLWLQRQQQVTSVTLNGSTPS